MLPSLIAVTLLALPHLASTRIATPAPSAEEPQAQKQEAPRRAPIYDEQVDARTQIAAALASAKKANRRVLVQWGANWCGWCHLLHAFCAKNEEVAKKIQYEYDVVLVDVGRMDKHLDVAASYGADVKKGIPYLSILDADGKLVAGVETGPLEQEVEGKPGYDPAAVLAVLTKHQAPYAQAEELYAAALALAKKDGKRLFLHFGAPWCSWCRKLDAWTARPEVAVLLAKEFVDVLIDVDRTIGGKELQAKTMEKAEAAGGNKGKGLPWFVFQDGDGRWLADNNGPQGCIGFPVEPAERAHFASMLAKAAVRLTPAEIETLVALLPPKKESSPTPVSSH